MMLAKSLDHLAKASRYDAESIVKEREEAAKLAVAKAEKKFADNIQKVESELGGNNEIGIEVLNRVRETLGVR